MSQVLGWYLLSDDDAADEQGGEESNRAHGDLLGLRRLSLFQRVPAGHSSCASGSNVRPELDALGEGADEADLQRAHAQLMLAHDAFSAEC